MAGPTQGRATPPGKKKTSELVNLFVGQDTSFWRHTAAWANLLSLSHHEGFRDFPVPALADVLARYPAGYSPLLGDHDAVVES